MALTYESSVNFKIDVKIEMPSGWEDIDDQDILEKNPDALPELGDGESYDPKLTLSIVDETNDAFTREYFMGWGASIDDNDQEVILLRDQQVLPRDMEHLISEFADEYMVYLRDQADAE